MIFKFTVLEKPWKLSILSIKDYSTKFGKDTLGITMYESREIYLPKDASYETFVHELTHAYLDGFYLEDLNLNPIRQHEFICEFLANHGKTILSRARQFYRRKK